MKNDDYSLSWSESSCLMLFTCCMAAKVTHMLSNCLCVIHLVVYPFISSKRLKEDKPYPSCIAPSSAACNEFEFDSAWTLNILNRFEIHWMFQVPCCQMRIHGNILVLQQISYAQQEVDCCTRIVPITTKLQSLNVEHTFCSQWCVKLY